MKKLMLTLSLITLGMFAVVNVFAQDVAFLYNKSSSANAGPKTLYVQLKCTNAAGTEKVVPGVVTLTVAPNSTSSSILTVNSASLAPYCSQDDNLTIGISTTANSLAYDYSDCAKVVKFTTAATPQASFTIDYTNGNPAYQCF